jgi:hypothetical protein
MRKNAMKCEESNHMADIEEDEPNSSEAAAQDPQFARPTNPADWVRLPDEDLLIALRDELRSVGGDILPPEACQKGIETCDRRLLENTARAAADAFKKGNDHQGLKLARDLLERGLPEKAGQLRGLAFYVFCCAALATNERFEGRRFVQAARDIDAEGRFGRQLDALDLFVCAQDLIQQGQYDLAIRHCNAVLETTEDASDPLQERALLLLSIAWRRKGDQHQEFVTLQEWREKFAGHKRGALSEALRAELVTGERGFWGKPRFVEILKASERVLIFLISV